MGVKRNRWLVGTILLIAIGALLALSFLPFLNAPLRSSRNESANASTPGTAPDQRAELEGRANGYELVLEREPNNQTALRGLVETRIALGDLDGLVEPLEKLAALNPQTPEYSVLLAQTKQQLGDLEGAAQVYRSALTQTPGNMEALQGLVALLIDQQRPQAAVGLLQDTLQTAGQANEIQPGSIDVVSVKLLLGQVYANQGQFDNAIAAYDAAIQDTQTLRPEQPDFRPTLAKALVLREMGQESEAQPLFTTALDLAPVQFKDRIQQLISEGAAEAAPAPAAATPAEPSTGTDDPSGAASDEAAPGTADSAP
ncbi:MAG: tetratricopeptide repeat protein [Leptolyngbya sp. SIO4C1]|nr:tetratricopeptide repeat protein [Leptolyngbya sp. SIO4C1]